MERGWGILFFLELVLVDLGEGVQSVEVGLEGCFLAVAIEIDQIQKLHLELVQNRQTYSSHCCVERVFVVEVVDVLCGHHVADEDETVDVALVDCELGIVLLGAI